jgi:gas vesicle protein
LTAFQPVGKLAATKFKEEFMGSQRTCGFVVGFVLGAAIGTIAGLMYAPRSGSELRRSLAETGAELKQRAADAGRRVRAAAARAGGDGPQGAKTRTPASDGR